MELISFSVVKKEYGDPLSSDMVTRFVRSLPFASADK